MQAFAALQHAYSILHRQDHDSTPFSVSHPEAEQAAGSQHNRLLLQAYEIPHTCWHLLSPYLQADAATIPCNMPFLAFPLGAAVRRQDQSGPSTVASGGEEVQPVTASGVTASNQQSVCSLQPVMSFQSSAKAGSSAAAAVVPAAVPAGPAASNAFADVNAFQEQRAAVVTYAKASHFADVSLHSSMTCCSAGIAPAACRSVATCTGSDSPSGSARSVPDAMGSAACAAGSALAQPGRTCQAGTAGASQMENADNLPGQSTVSIIPACKGPEYRPGDGQGQGQSPGQDQGMVQMALLVPCRKAMRDRFPLNGTFFQVNEVFLDHSSIAQPLQVQIEHEPSTSPFTTPFTTPFTNEHKPSTLSILFVVAAPQQLGATWYMLAAFLIL